MITLSPRGSNIRSWWPSSNWLFRLTPSLAALTMILYLGTTMTQVILMTMRTMTARRKKITTLSNPAVFTNSAAIIRSMTLDLRAMCTMRQPTTIRKKSLLDITQEVLVVSESKKIQMRTSFPKRGTRSNSCSKWYDRYWIWITKRTKIMAWVLTQVERFRPLW